MSDAAAATPAKAPKKKSAGKAKKPASHPKYSKMIKDALAALKVRWGSFAYIDKPKVICIYCDNSLQVRRIVTVKLSLVNSLSGWVNIK